MISQIAHIIQRSPGKVLGEFVGALALFLILFVGLNLPAVL